MAVFVMLLLMMLSGALGLLSLIALVRGRVWFIKSRAKSILWLFGAVVTLIIAVVIVPPVNDMEAAANQARTNAAEARDAQKTSNTKAPLAIAGGFFATGGKENRITNQRIDADGTFRIERQYFPFAKNRTEVLMSFRDFAQAIFGSNSEITKISVTTLFPFDDGYGNYTWRKASTIEMTRNTASKINWNNFQLSAIPKVADLYWEAPFLRD